MAMDNVLALFLLPLFGHISDKCTHPRGRQTPFIVVGTLVAESRQYFYIGKLEELQRISEKELYPLKEK